MVRFVILSGKFRNTRYSSVLSDYVLGKDARRLCSNVHGHFFCQENLGRLEARMFRGIVIETLG